MRASSCVRCLILPVGTWGFLANPGSSIRMCNYGQHEHTQTLLHMSDASGLLYQEQEKLIIKRGELEQEMMEGMGTGIETPKIKIRGAGGGGGFGNSSSSKGKKSAQQAEGKAYAKVLKKEGVVRIDNVLSPDTADRIREYVYDLRKRSEDEVASGTVQPLQRFADVLLKKERCDLTLPLGDDVITDGLDDALRKSPVASTISSILGKDAVLYEFSCLISDPGSQRQVLHPDTPFLEGKGPVLYTTFIALQDVRLDMGPTTWLPRTNTAKAHEAFQEGSSSKDELIKKSKVVLGLLPKGSCAIFDSRLLHAGTSNQSKEDSRALFYFSFKSPKVGYPGNPASIRPELGAAQVTLSAIEKDLESHSKGMGHTLIDECASRMH